MLNQQNINQNPNCRGVTLVRPSHQESQKNHGITLVALIVTIIILLILAGVTIALLSGEDGILSRTEKAATSYQTESIKEVVNLKLANLNAGKWIDEGRKAVLKDLNELDDENSSNFDSEITLKSQVGDTDTSAILIYDNHEVEVDSSLNIAKIDGEKYEGTSNGTSSSESGSASGGNSSSIDSAEYAQMQETIAQMQEKINQLEAKNATIEEKYAIKTDVETEFVKANTKIDSAQNQIDHMLTTLDVDTRTTLFEGTAGTVNTDYTISDLSEYKYIIIYADVLMNSVRANRSSMLINVNDIIYNNSSNRTDNSHYQIGNTATASAYYAIGFWFKNSSTMYIAGFNNDGWTSPRIYKIEGIK